MENKHIEVELTFTIVRNRLLAHLVFSNNTLNNLWVDKFLICYKNSIREDLFNVFDDNNCRVEYLGPFVKRDKTEEDYLPMGPGEMVEASVVLNEAYGINNGMRYTVQYSAYHPDIGGTAMTRVESVPVEIIY